MNKYFDGYASFDWNKMSNQKLVSELKEKCRYIGKLKQQHKEEFGAIQSAKDKKIADLQSQLTITEKALELACETLQDINFKLYNTEMNFVDFFKQQAKEMLENE